MVVKLGYKQTELGVFPQDWEVRRLAEVGSTYGGLTGKKKADFGVGTGRYVTFTNVMTNVVIDTEMFEQVRVSPGESQNLVCKGDLLFNGSSETPEEVGMCSFMALDVSSLFLNSFCFGFRLRHEREADGRFLAYYLRANPGRELMKSLAQGSTRYNLSKGALLEASISLPPLPEQRSIAEALSDVDALLSGLDRLIAKKRDLKQAAMQQLLTGQTRLPGFHGEWEVKRLGEMAILNRIIVLPSQQPERQFVHFSLPAFDNGKIANVELGGTIGSNKFVVPSKAVLVSKLNPRIPRIWAPSTIPENAVASTEWLILTPREGIDRNYLFVLCSSPAFCERMELAATGTTGSHQRISPAAALNIRVSVATDSNEQTAIAQVLSDMDAELAALETRREKTRQLKQGMMQELLTGRTRLVRPEERVV